MNDTKDKIIRLYSRLNSLKQNLPGNISIINETFIKEYHSIANELQKIINSDPSEFKIPDNEIRPTLRSLNYRTGEQKYTKDRYCDRAFLMTKLDALLYYFQTQHLSQEKRTIGFNME